MTAELVFPRRAFQRELIGRLRSSSGAITLDRALLGDIIRSLGRVDSIRDEKQASDAVEELIEQRILISAKTPWTVGDECRLSPSPILGETPEERFANLPTLPGLPRGMILTGNALLVLDAVLFFIFYCVYLPQSWIGPVTGTGAFIGAILSYVGLKLSDQNAVTALRWTLRKWFAVAATATVLLALNLVGFFHPCVVSAPPGTGIFVDGKLQKVVPILWDMSQDDYNNPKKWLENSPVYLHLRWDPHDVRLVKKWYVDEQFNSEPSTHVFVHWAQPLELFKDWHVTALISPLLRIALDPSQVTDEKLLGRLVAWDQTFQLMMFDSFDDLSARPLTLRVSLHKRPDRSGALDCRFVNLGGDLLLPFPKIDIKDCEAEENWNEARRQVFSNLERVLQMHGLVGKEAEVKQGERAGQIILQTQQAVKAGGAEPAQNLAQELNLIASEENAQLALLAKNAQHQLNRVAPTATPIATGKIQPRVYIHIAGESQRKIAEELSTRLRQATPTGFSVPGIQNVFGRSFIPDRLEIRYYTESPSALAQIKDIVTKAGAPSVQTVRIKPSERDIAESRDISSHYEIWFGRDWR
jgi:hypothetical protein